MSAENGTASQSRQSAGSGGGRYRKYDEEPYLLNRDETLEPEAAEGGYIAKINETTIKPSKQSGNAMIQLDLVLRRPNPDAEKPGNDDSVGATLRSYIVFYPKEEKSTKGARMFAERLRLIMTAVDANFDTLPRRLNDPDNDLKPLAKELKLRELPVWVRHKTGDDNLIECEVEFSAPRQRGGGARTPVLHDDDDDDDQPAKKKPAARIPMAARRR
jgi:hypothetical protein